MSKEPEDEVKEHDEDKEQDKADKEDEPEEQSVSLVCLMIKDREPLPVNHLPSLFPLKAPAPRKGHNMNYKVHCWAT